MDKKKIAFYIYQGILLFLYIFLIVFFIVKCLETGAESSQSSQAVAEIAADAINTVRPNNPVSSDSPSFQTFIRKFIGHYSYFVVLGLISVLLFLSLPKPKHYIRIIIHYGLGFGFAIISEFILEGNTKGRGPSWMDVGIDSLGFITLSIIVILGYYLLYRKKINSVELEC